MTDRCDERAVMRRGAVTLRCDRDARHTLLDGEWHYDWTQDVEWRWTLVFHPSGVQKALSVEYRPEPEGASWPGSS